MGRQIIKQPNGRYAVFSSVVDHVVLYNCTVDDLIEEAVKQANEDIERHIRETVAELEAGGRPYHQFTMDWKEMVRTIKSHHGKNDEDLKQLLHHATLMESDAEDEPATVAPDGGSDDE